MDTSELIIKIVQILYGAALLFTAFFGAFSIYILLKYGEKRTVALAASIVFIIIFLGLAGNSYHSLLSISL